MKKYFRNIKIGFSNLIYYFKVIWKDRQWDYDYIENLLLLKYKRMYAYMNSDDCMASVDQDEYNQALRICINILERRQNDWYTSIWYLRSGQYLKYNWIDVTDDSNLKQLKIDNLSDKIDKNYQHPNKYSDLVEERDWKLYCKLIEKYHRTWWN